MNNYHRIGMWVLLVALVATVSTSNAFAAEKGKGKGQPEFKSIFNGKDLAGWEGDKALWSVQDGAITGTTTDEAPLAYNKFLIYKGGEVDNFVLRAKVRLIGNSNSGIQYRSKVRPDLGEYVVSGYQCDIHPTAANNGMLYEEKGRGIMAFHGQSAVILPNGDRKLAETVVEEPAPAELPKWHTYTIIARGNKLTHKINGKTVSVIVDHEKDARAMSGVLAFQVHRGPAMKVQLKDIQLKKLKGGKVLKPSDTPVPADAPPAGKAPRKK
jgi:hypothetical protein